MKNLKELKIEEIKNINGGTFAYDLGWFLASGLSGQFSTSSLTAMALIKRDLHYS